MSDFVNFNKRDINLPGGCKNLADVLAKKSRAFSKGAPTSGPTQEPLKPEKLSAIEAYVLRAWGSSAPSLYLGVRPGNLLEFNTGTRLKFTFYRAPGLRVAEFQVRMGTEEESALRAFLESFDYAVPDTPVPEQFMADQPVEVLCEIRPLPDDPRTLSSLVMAVFRQVAGLTNDSEITILYKEGDA